MIVGATVIVVGDKVQKKTDPGNSYEVLAQCQGLIAVRALHGRTQLFWDDVKNWEIVVPPKPKAIPGLLYKNPSLGRTPWPRYVGLLNGQVLDRLQTDSDGSAAASPRPLNFDPVEMVPFEVKA